MFHLEQRYKDKSAGRLGWRGPRTLARTSDANLDCAIFKNTLVFEDPKIGGLASLSVQPRIKPPSLLYGSLALLLQVLAGLS